MVAFPFLILLILLAAVAVWYFCAKHFAKFGLWSRKTAEPFAKALSDPEKVHSINSNEDSN